VSVGIVLTTSIAFSWEEKTSTNDPATNRTYTGTNSVILEPLDEQIITDLKDHILIDQLPNQTIILTARALAARMGNRQLTDRHGTVVLSKEIIEIQH